MKTDSIGTMNTKNTLYRTSVVGMMLAAHCAEAFVSPASSNNNNGIHKNSGCRPLYSDGSGQTGRLERIEFKIFPDGRVEEKVQGVQGEACLEVTRQINEKLGNVISTTPTEEMYQEEVKLDQTLINGNTEGSGDSWEGSSSW